MPAEIQTARALSVTSALIWFIMMIVGVMGLECTVYKKGTMHKVDYFSSNQTYLSKTRRDYPFLPE